MTLLLVVRSHARFEHLQMLLWALDMVKELELLKQPDAFHLMKHGIVTGIDLVTSVHVSDDQKVVQAHRDQLGLVGRSVSSEHGVLVDVVRV